MITKKQSQLRAKLVSAISELIDSTIKMKMGDIPYWSGQIQEAEKELGEAINEIFDNFNNMRAD